MLGFVEVAKEEPYSCETLLKEENKNDLQAEHPKETNNRNGYYSRG